MSEAKEKDATETKEGSAPEAPKKGKKKLLVILVAVLLLGGAGGGGFWWWRRSHLQAASASAPEVDPTGIIAMDAFLVNLRDHEASRFLRVTLRLVVDEEGEAKEVEEDPVRRTQVRSAILELLATKESHELVTAEGKAALKREIAERSTKILKLEVRDVLFTDFVVQF